MIIGGVIIKLKQQTITGKEIQELRKILKKTQKDFASEYGISRSMLAMIENERATLSEELKTEMLKLKEKHLKDLANARGFTSLGARIGLLRTQKMLSYKDFGVLINVPGNLVEQYERNEVEIPSDIVDNICEVFQISKEWLLNGTGSIDDIKEAVKKVQNIRPISLEEQLPLLFGNLIKDTSTDGQRMKTYLFNLLTLPPAERNKAVRFTENFIGFVRGDFKDSKETKEQ